LGATKIKTVKIFKWAKKSWCHTYTYTVQYTAQLIDVGVS
jgi:hypothetical protein